MKKGTVYRLFELINRNGWLPPMVSIIICVVAYWQLQNRELSSQLLNLINLFFLISEIFFAFRWIRKKQSTECWVYCVLMLTVIFNRLYEPDVFQNLFHIPFSYAVIGVVGYGVLRVAGYYIFKIMKGAADIAKEAADGWITAENEKRAGGVAVKHDSQRDSFYQKRSGDKAENDKERGKSIERGNGHVLIFLILISLVIPIVCGKIIITSLPLFIETYAKETEPSAIMSFINMGVAIFTTIVIVLIMWAAFLGLLIEIWFAGVHLWEDLKSSFNDKNKMSSLTIKLFVHTIIVGIICIYWYSNNSFEVDDFNDLLLNGRIFIYPIAIAVIMPVYLLLVNWITNPNNIKQLLEGEGEENEIKQLLKDISIGTITTLLNFIKFVTKDFLTAIQNLVWEDEEETKSDEKP